MLAFDLVELKLVYTWMLFMINLEKDIVRMQQGCAEVSVVAKANRKRHDRLVIDIYNLDCSRHPEDHLGWWLFHFQKKLTGKLRLDFTCIEQNSVLLEKEDSIITPADCWFNPEYHFSPVQDLHLIIRDSDNRAIQKETYQLVNDEPAILKKFYDNLHATDGYKTTGNTFLETMHGFKLGILKTIFNSMLKDQDRVLDVGCGNSLFTEIAPLWNFQLVCCDLGEPVIKERIRLFPQYQWLVADVHLLPFDNHSFDALFAGEIIEHMPSIQTTLQQWWRVLKPGGIMILTTPNRMRLRNRANHSRRPLGPDHLNELSYDEIITELEECGFTVLQSHGFYLELFLNWWSRRAKIDYLQSSGNVLRNVKLMNVLNYIGRFFPRYALGLIFVAQKKK